MKKKVERIIVDQDYYCDICGETTIHRICYICKRDICSKHIKYYYNGYSSYMDKCCIDCWNIGSKYLEQIKKITEEGDEKISTLEAEWVKKAIETIKDGENK